VHPATVGYSYVVNDAQIIQASADVVSRVVEGEAVLLDLASGKYFGLNEVGSRVWELAQNSITVGALFQQLRSEFDVAEETLRTDLDALLADLQAKKLIAIS
jgi:predicted transcriptional regulator